MLKDFYCGKKVLVTGHTGFKGTWLVKWLTMLGAEVSGVALPPETAEGERFFLACNPNISSHYIDIRDLPRLEQIIRQVKPEIIFHLAAQPIVLKSYTDPATTYSTNVMGTVNLLEAVRRLGGVPSLVIVTTDKVYRNREWEWGYRETDDLDGFDPYANSKSCAELVVGCYRRSFFSAGSAAISTLRAGNVIGGGDFSPHRIIPDCVRAATAGRTVKIRNPCSVRPYQHVLEPLYAYLLVAKSQYERSDLADSYNVGPAKTDCIATGVLADMFCQSWGEDVGWEYAGEKEAPHEANFLYLDSSRLQNKIGWRPNWSISRAIEETVSWAKAALAGEDMGRLTEEQIGSFMREATDCQKGGYRGNADDLQSI